MRVFEEESLIFYYCVIKLYMLNILVFHFGDSARINLFIKELETKKNLNLYIFNFFDKKDFIHYKNTQPYVEYDGVFLLGTGGKKFDSCIDENILYKIIIKDPMPWRKGCSVSNLEELETYPNDNNFLENMIYIINKNKNKPILGLCYGFQLLNYYYGGTLRFLKFKNTGNQKTSVDSNNKLFRGVDKDFYANYNHYYYCENNSYGVKNIATSERLPNVAKMFSPIHFGAHFHIIHSDETSNKIIDNFLKIVKDEKNKGFFDRFIDFF